MSVKKKKEFLVKTLTWETQEDGTYEHTFNVPNKYKKLIGVFFNTTDANAVVGLTCKLVIDGVEVLPADFDVDLITQTSGVPFKDLHWPLDIGEIGNTKVDIVAVDGGMPGAIYPLKLKMYFLFEL